MEQFLSAKFLSGRHANLKTGIVGVSTDDKVLEVVGRVGIGSTIFEPTVNLDVRGSVNVRDNLTLNGLSVGSGSSLSNTVISQLQVTGVSTFVGFSTFNDSVDVQDDLLVRGNTRTLGITTLAESGGITTTGGDLYVRGDLYVGDDVRLDEFTSRNGNITGIGTIATLSATTGRIVTGVVTTISGTNLNYSGIGTIATLNSTTGTITNLSGTNINYTGIITAAQFSTGSGTLGFNTNTISGPAEIIIDPSPVGVGTTSGVVRVRGDLYVDGTQFVVNSTTIELADLNVGIATTVGTNALLDGGGIGIGSANIRKTFTYASGSDSLKSSENLDLASGKVYKINGTEVISSSQLTISNINSGGISTLGVTTVTNLTAQSINSSGIITASAGFVGNLTGTASSATYTVIAGIATYAPTAGLSTYAVTAGIATYAITAGIATYTPTAGLSTYAVTAGIATYAPTAGLSTYAVRAGIATLAGNAGFATVAGIATYTPTAGLSTYAVTSGIATYAPTAGLSTYAVTAGIATYALTAGLSTYAVVAGIATLAGNAGFATVAGIATYTPTAGLSTYAVTAGIATYTPVAGLSTYAIAAGIATYAPTAGLSTYAVVAGIATLAGNAGFATVAGIATYAPTAGLSTYAVTAGIASYTPLAGVTTALQTSRNFSITGNFVTATAISFNGTGDVALAATITADSIGLGTYTSGDYVKNITGTANQITVTGGTGEGSTPTLSIPSQFTAPQDVTVTRDLQVNRNLNVTGNITIGGTSATIFATTLNVSDPDLILGVRTDGSGNDISNDTTANHGGIAIASTEGTPLVPLYNPGIGESTASTYKKIMWFKSGSFSGLGTDAWLINYAVGIGSTQFPTGTRLAAGNVQFTQNDLAVVRNINASGGIITATTFSGTSTYAVISGLSTYAIAAGIATYAPTAGLSTYAVTAGIATYAPTAGLSTYAVTAGIATYSVTAGIATLAGNAGFSTVAGIATYAPTAGLSTYAVTAGIATYAITAGIATYTPTAGLSTSVSGGTASVTQLNVSGVSTFSGIATHTAALFGTTASFTGVVTASSFNGNASSATYASVAGLSTYAVTAGIATYAPTAGLSTYAVVAGIATLAGNAGFATVAGIATYAPTAGLSTYAVTAGIATYAPTAGIATYAITSGIATYAITAGISTYTPIAGLSTSVIGGISSVTQLNVLGVSTLGTVQVSSGVVTATSGVVTYYGDGSKLTGIQATSIVGVTSYSLIAGIATYAPTAGLSTYAVVAGIATLAGNAGFATVAGIATYAVTAGIATYAPIAGLSTYAVTSGIATYSVVAGIATLAGNAGFATVAGIATYAPTAGLSTYAVTAGIATYAPTAGLSTYAVTAGIATYAPTAGIASALTSTASVNTTGIITAAQFSTGSGTLGFNTNTISGPAEIIIDPSPVGVGTTSGVVRIRGDLYVDGTQFIVNSSTIELADLRVGIATTVGTNALLDGGGIGIGSANIQKTFTYNSGSDSLKSSENLDIATGKTYKINGTDVLSATTLGSSVVNSSLTSVGTLGQLNVSGVSTFSGITTRTAALFGTTASFSGVVTASSFSGNASSATYAPTAGIATYAVTAGIATYASTAGIATYAVTSGIATYAPTTGIATYSVVAGIATLAGNAGFATVAGIATYAPTAGLSTYAVTAGIATYAITAGIATYAPTAGVSTSVSGGTASVTQLNVSASGISTLGTVQVSSGIVTATSGVVTYYGDGSKLTGIQATSIVGVTSYATSAGIATNLKGGSGGTLVYQSAVDTTAFLANGTAGFILQSNGGTSAPSWVPAASAGAITGITILDEGAVVGSASSISQINFVGNIVSVAATAGIATVTFGDYIRASGIATYAVVAGIATLAGNAGFSTVAGIATYAPTAGLSTYAVVAGIATLAGNAGFATVAGIATYAPTAGLSTYAVTAGIATYTPVAGLSTYAVTAGIATYAPTAGISTNLKGGSGGTLVYQSSTDTTAFLANGTAGFILQSNGGTSAPSWVAAAPAGAITGLTIRDEGTIVGAANSVSQINFVGNIISVASTAGIATVTLGDYITASGIATYAPNAGFSTVAGIATYAPTAGLSTYAVTAGIATYTPTAGLSTYAVRAGLSTYAVTAGIATYTPTAGVATALQNARNFSITGSFVTATAVSFDGTGNVALAATITADSIGLGTYTSGDYVRTISGTSNQITVTSGTGEGSAPVLSIPSQFTAPQDVTVTRDLQVNRNLNVTGNITIGGTSATIFATTLNVSDPDLILGVRTDGSGNDISNDTTANHGGIAIASTEGSPLVPLYNPGIGESTLPTYKKIMWFKSGSFTGLNTDAWLINYAVGIGSTQFPVGTRLAAGSVQFTESDLAVVRNINASGGIITATTFSGNASSATYAPTAGIATYAPTAGLSTYTVTAGIATYAPTAGLSTYAVRAGIATLAGNAGFATVAGIATYAPTAGLSTYAVTSGIATYAPTSGLSTYAVTAGIATYTPTAGVSTSVSGGTGSLTQLQVTGISTFTNGPVLIGSATSTGTANQRLQVTGGAYISTSTGIGTTNPLQTLHIQGNLLVAAGSATTQHIVQKAYEVNNGTLSWEGSAGQLFSITNNLTSGSIFSVNDVSGIPSVDVNADGTVTLAPYADGNVGIATTRPTSRLHVIGDANITGVVTAASFSGNASSATYAPTAGIATYAPTAGLSTYAVTAGIATYAPTAGLSTYAVTAGIATYAPTAGLSTYSVRAGIATLAGNAGFATVAGIATYAPTAGIATYAVTAGIATYAPTAGISTNLKGGSGGTLVYQSGADTTAFLANGSSGFILQSNGGTNAPSWVAAAPANAITGLTIRDEGTIVSTANSFSQLNFVGNIVSAAGTATSGIATITFADYIAVAGIATLAGNAGFSTVAGIATYAPTAGLSTYAVTAGIATYTIISGVSTYAITAGIATYAPTAGVSTSVSGGTGSLTQLQVTGISTFTNGPVFIGAANSTGTPNQRLQVTGGGYVSGSVGLGTTIPQYILTVTDTGTPATAGLTNCLADFTTTANSYGQINLRNTSTGTNASSDVIVTADNGTDTTNFIDLGINNSGFSVGSWTINGANDGYLYTSDGNLSIGAINASVAKYISFFTGGTLISNERMRINATGIGIGTTNPTARLTVSGDTFVTGVVTATDFNSASDARLKTNIQPIANPIAKVEQLQGVSFNWIENNKPSMGVIADELQRVLPELVTDTDPKTVNYNGLIGLLIEVVKEQQVKIESLENRISKLE